jgi:hypothetical protein
VFWFVLAFAPKTLLPELGAAFADAKGEGLLPKRLDILAQESEPYFQMPISLDAVVVVARSRAIGGSSTAQFETRLKNSQQGRTSVGRPPLHRPPRIVWT